MTGISRRLFLKGTAAAGVLLATPFPVSAVVEQKELMCFLHTHTGERLTIEVDEGRCSSAAMARLNDFLRDFRTGEVHPMDPGLLEILSLLRRKTGCSGTIEVISGYRSPLTNAILRSKSGGVAKRSLHLQGKALDFRINGFDTATLRAAAIALKKGGVGYYAKSNFLHIDTGRFRTW